MARLKEQYINEIAPALNKKFGYKSVMQIPRLDKVVVNVGCGEARENPKVMDAIIAAHDGGLPATEIAAAAGIHRSRVYQIVRESSS